MAVTREAAIEALFAKLSGAYTFGVATRRPTMPSQLASSGGGPGFALVIDREVYERKINMPPVRTIHAKAIIYVDVGANANAIPDAILNPIKDAFDAALAPDNRVTGLCTLGGVVYAAYIRGEVIQAPGDMTGKGLALMPVEVILP